MQSNEEIVIEAIRTRRQVVACYDGHWRRLCPHVIGYKRGRLQALFYQFGGSSGSGLKPLGHPGNWRCIPVDAMIGMESVEGTWFTSANHSRPQTCVDHIIAQVPY